MLMAPFRTAPEKATKPSRYLVRPDYPGETQPRPRCCAARDPVMTRALIDSIDTAMEIHLRRSVVAS